MSTTLKHSESAKRLKLETYVMLYASQNIAVNAEDKRQFFAPRISKEDYNSICREFNSDSDISCIEKIINGIKELCFSKQDVMDLFAHLKQMCAACNQSSVVDKFRLQQLNNLILF